MANLDAQDHFCNEQDKTLQKFLAGLISTQNAAELLALATLAIEPDGGGLSMFWGRVIMPAIRESSDQDQMMLVDLLVHMANLPPVRDSNGRQLEVCDMLVWDDLPQFGWDINDEWNHFGPPDEGPERHKMVTEFINVNKCTARLLKTGMPVFSSFDVYGLCTMRETLETPLDEIKPELPSPQTFIPAAAAWLSILGEEMYSWDIEFPYGDRIGDPGAGGPLWDGQHGFCKERWQLWRRRFGELSLSDELTRDQKEMCKEAEARMSEIEARQKSNL